MNQYDKSIVAAIATFGIVGGAATALAQAPVNDPLPNHGEYILGPGRNPILGIEPTRGEVAVHYMSEDPSAPGFKIWNPLLQTVDSPVAGPINPLGSFEPYRCAWGDVLFCTGKWMLGTTHLGDKVRAYDLFSNASSDSSYNFGTLTNSAIEAAGPHGVFEANASEIRRLYFSDGQYVDASLAQTGTVRGHPAISVSTIAYQHQAADGPYELKAYDIDSGLYYSYTLRDGSTVPRPSRVGWGGARGEVSFDYEDTVVTGYIGDNSEMEFNRDYQFDPAEQGCESFHRLKLDRPDIQLVQGIECAEGPSVLFALVPLLNQGYKAFFVGTLSASAEYDAFDNVIVYVNGEGNVVWVVVDTNRSGMYRRESYDPNDDFEHALHMGEWQYGVGWLTPGDTDFWSMDLEAGEHYRIASSVGDTPNTICWNEPWQDTVIALYGPDGQKIDENDSNFVEMPDGYIYLNDCGVIEFVPSVTGRYFVEIWIGRLGPFWEGSSLVYSIASGPQL